MRMVRVQPMIALTNRQLLSEPAKGSHREVVKGRAETLCNISGGLRRCHTAEILLLESVSDQTLRPK